MVKKVSSIIAIILVLVIIGLTIYKINNRHENKLYDVLYSKIEYASNKCYLDKKCEKSFTLKELYDFGYLEVLYDPISKEEINNNLKIDIKNDKVNIDGRR